MIYIKFFSLFTIIINEIVRYRNNFYHKERKILNYIITTKFFIITNDKQGSIFSAEIYEKKATRTVATSKISFPQRVRACLPCMQTIIQAPRRKLLYYDECCCLVNSQL